MFALLGTTYGGDGVQTFALPNLQSRLPVHQGTGTGLSNYQLGQAAGSENVMITQSTMPQHTHGLNASPTIATATAISGTVVPGQPSGSNAPLFYAAQQDGQPAPIPQLMGPRACTITGSSFPHTNLMPSLCITFVIALQGVFPSRN